MSKMNKNISIITSSELIELKLFALSSSTDLASPVVGDIDAGGNAVIKKDSFFTCHLQKEKI